MRAADLIVIGGGPAGAAAAITAARSGARVMLFEAGRFPRHKVCGEFVSAESLGVLRQLLDVRNVGLLDHSIRIRQARLFVDGHTLPVEIEPAAASIPRFDLDAALWESAVRAGVETVQQRVLEVTGDGPFVVRVSNGEFGAHAVVNASGRWSNLRAEQERPKTNAKWIGLKAHFSEARPAESVDLYFFDGGYCGVQPVDPDMGNGRRRVNACAMVRADVASSLAEVLDLHPALRERGRQWQPISDPVSVAPLQFETPQAVRERILNVGDAAGFVDPFVGDGISLALRSGEMAGQCLAEFVSGASSLERAASNYAREYEHRLAAIFRSSSRLRRMLLVPRAMRAAVLAVLARTPAVTRYLVRKTR